MKCDASNNVKNVVNSLKIIYLSSACSECTPIYSSRARICKRLRSPGIDSSSRFRQPMQPGGPVQQIGLSYRPTRLKSIPELLKRFTNTGSGARQSASLAFYQLCLCFSPVLLSSAHVYALHACLSKRAFLLPLQVEENKTTACRQAKIISRWPCVCIS